MGTSILLASLIVASMACFGLLVYVLLLVMNFSLDEQEAVAEGKVTRQAWRRRSASIIGECSLAFFVLLVVSLHGFQTFAKRIGRFSDEARSARYEACLERTTAEVCEIHWVRLPGPDSEGGPSLDGPNPFARYGARRCPTPTTIAATP